MNRCGQGSDTTLWAAVETVEGPSPLPSWLAAARLWAVGGDLITRSTRIQESQQLSVTH